MNFENKTPEWPKEGIEPSSEIKSKGFAPGYKPPAAYFNWFWNSVSKNLAEIKTKLSNVDNTADSEKTVKRAVTAGTADKTAQKMTVQLNGGTTEGTDKFTFDGSAAKSVDITKDAIGLGNVDNTADSTKSVSFASTAGSANKTKSAMTVRLNGGSSEGQDKYTFDGSVAKSVNITPASIGAASTANGAVVSNGSDYAICFQWSDGNPNKDVRTNRFVRLTDGGNKISHATSSADICGVTTDSAAFVENYGVASDSTALVGVMGVVTVIDNGTCTVGNTCMSDDNGYATPSSNSMGYRVMERVDDTKVKIAVKPNDDMVQRIKADIVSIKSGMKEVYTKAQVDEKTATDTTLSVEGKAADAKTVGNKFKSIKTDWNSVTDKPSTFPPSAHNHSKLAFENNNEVNFVGIPEDNTVYWGYRDNTIDEYRFNDGRGSGAFANVRANKFIGSLDGNANTATKTTGITDYNSSSRTIQVGYAGDGLNTSNLTHIAGYTDDGTKIKDVSKAVLQSWLGIGEGSLAAYPVGAIYISTSSTSPASLFGGTWESIASERVLMGVSSSHGAGSTVSAGLPNISGTFSDLAGGSISFGGAFSQGTPSRITLNYQQSSDSAWNWNYIRNGTFNASRSSSIYGNSGTVQPAAYYVYMWRRTA